MTDVESKFDGNQTKLLYTLHWMILDAASECEDNDSDKALGRSFYSYMHTLDNIQLFVYLFAPLVSSLKSADFQSLKLEPGEYFSCIGNIVSCKLIHYLNRLLFSCNVM